MTYVNLFDKEVVLYKNESLPPIIFPPEGPIQVRCKTEDITPNGIVKRGVWTHTRDLPPSDGETLYIVGSLVAMFELYENNRLDLVFPWGKVRTESGDVIACRALVRPERRRSKD